MNFALEQIKSLILYPSRPVIISDADEVILHFADILSEYLLSQGMYVNFTSYALEGNIKYLKTDKPVEKALFESMINDYFDKNVERQPLVKDAARSLASLSEFCTIIILTNIPHNFADRRRKILSTLGLNYPMISNSGHKGPVLKAIREMTNGKMIFIDDISHHHHSAEEHVPDALRIQFIANEKLDKIEKKSESCHHRCRDWRHIEEIIRHYVQAEAPPSIQP